MNTVHLLPFGTLPPGELAFMARTITARFACRAEILPAARLPDEAFRRARRQYDADTLLEHLFDRLDPRALRLIGVTDCDLFAEGRNFVFGYAHMRDRVAVFSTLRLREQSWRRPDAPGLFEARVEKAIAHELGHTLHAPHCPEPECVMRQVEFLWQLDDLTPSYCGGCRERVGRALARTADSPETLFELAGSYMRRRRFTRAATTYAEATARDPGNAHYHNDHGVALLAIGDRVAASAAFRRALTLRPGSPFAYYNLGIVAREQGEHVEADRWFDEALRRDDDPRAGHRYLGILHQDYFKDTRRARRHLAVYCRLGGEDLEVVRRLRGLTPSKRAEGPPRSESAEKAESAVSFDASIDAATAASSVPV